MVDDPGYARGRDAPQRPPARLGEQARRLGFESARTRQTRCGVMSPDVDADIRELWDALGALAERVDRVAAPRAVRDPGPVYSFRGCRFRLVNGEPEAVEHDLGGGPS